MATASSIEIRRAEAQEQAASDLAEIKAALRRIEKKLDAQAPVEADTPEAATGKTQKLDAKGNK